jgi:hypothetical protein
MARKPQHQPKGDTAMQIKKFYLVLTMLIAMSALFQLPARADESTETTKVTFSAPVEVPGHALPAGTYIFERANDSGLREVVHIFNADHTVLYATMQTIPVDRMQTTSDPSITLAEQGSGNPDVLVSWFYGDSLTGHEFIYPNREEKELKQAKLDTFENGQLVSGAQLAGE